MTVVGKFLTTEVMYEGCGDRYQSVTVTLMSTGPINVNEMRELVSTVIELRRTPKGFSAYGKIDR